MGTKKRAQFIKQLQVVIVLELIVSLYIASDWIFEFRNYWEGNTFKKYDREREICSKDVIICSELNPMNLKYWYVCIWKYLGNSNGAGKQIQVNLDDITILKI